MAADRRTGVKQLSRLEVIQPLPREFGHPITILPWCREALAAIDNPSVLMILVILVRQSSKSQFMLSATVSELLTMPNAYVLYVAANEIQVQAVYDGSCVPRW
jgi:hypothetical protein